ncbi:MAG: VOC family protein [Bacteroidetes bacterium]|nr:VOC family protein [Bacteroidota bacterium]
MRRALVLLALLVATSSMAQHRSMRLLLPARDFSGYAKFLHTFGFTTLDSVHSIVRLGDGQVFAALMRLDDELKGPQLALFVDDIGHVDTLLSTESGVNVFRGEDGQISEIDVHAPGGVMLFIHPSAQGSMQQPPMTANPACGAFVEFSVPVTDVDAAAKFWKLFGFAESYRGEQPHRVVRLGNGSFTIGLHQDPNTERSITYASRTAAEMIEAIRAKGIEPILSDDGKNGGAVMASFESPEGLIVNILGLR